MNELLTPEETAQEIKRLIGLLQAEGRRDLLLKAIGVPLLEELRIEAARRKLSRLVITRDYRFVLEDYHREVDLQPCAQGCLSALPGASGGHRVQAARGLS